MTIASERERPPDVLADVNYIRNPPTEPGEVLEFVTEAEELSTMQTLPGRAVRITDARSIRHRARSGGLRPRAPRQRGRGLRPDPGRCRGRPAATSTRSPISCAGSPARRRAFMLGGGKKRYGESATDKLASLSNAKPARYPHADNTDTSAGGLVDMIARSSTTSTSPATRGGRSTTSGASTTPPPQDFPLAVCDARTPHPARRGDGQGDHRGARRATIRPRHHRLPLQPGPPLVLLPRHDAGRGARVQGARHRPARERVASPTPRSPIRPVPPGVPTRASVEMRGLALFD